MDHFAGLDVSVKQTSVCIVDDTGSCDCLNRMLSDHAFKTKPDHGCS